jgi:hypothetical protein
VTGSVRAERRGRRRLLLRVLLRAFGTVGLSLAAYYWLPLPERSDAVTVVQLIVGLATMVVVIGWHVRAIVASRYPRLRAIEALAIAAPMFLLLYAAAYYLVARSSRANFGQELSRTDALYFTVTVFSTTGFGDITARSAGARLLVTGQMIGNMIFIGFGLRQLVTASQVGLRRRSDPGTTPPGGD